MSAITPLWPSLPTSFDLSESFLPPIMASNIIYRDLLMHKRHGLPFWTPEPDANLPEAYRKLGISIGDLGLLTDDGGFDYLFNIHAAADDPVNQHFGTPDYFSPLPLNPDLDIRKIELFHNQESCITNGVSSQQSVTLGVGAEVVYVVSRPSCSDS